MNFSRSSLKSELFWFVALSLLFHLSLLFLAVKVPAFLSAPHQRTHDNDFELTLLNDNPDNNEAPRLKPKLLSMEQSRAHGQVTTEKGMNLVLPEPGAKGEDKVKVKDDAGTGEAASDGEVVITDQERTDADPGEQGQEGVNIPEHYEFNVKEALNIDSRGQVSYDTEKYPEAAYFRGMTDKIASAWYRAIPGTAHYLGMIPSGEVRILFALNRDGEVLDYRVVKDFNYSSMTRASEYAVTHGGPFGRLPDSMKDEVVVIPFTFKYIGRK